MSLSRASLRQDCPWTTLTPPANDTLVAQSNIKSSVVLIYDPSRARTSGIALRAFRLTDTFMMLYADGKVSYDALASANQNASADVFQELPITVRNSHLNSALLLELQDECSIKCARLAERLGARSGREMLPSGALTRAMSIVVRSTNASDCSRLELNTNPFLEKQLQLLIDCIEDLQQESNKLHAYERAVQRQKSAHATFLAKKRAEIARRSQGEEPTEEELSAHPAFKPIQKPSRLDSLLVTNQMAAYLQQVNQFSGQSFVKLFLMQSLNASQQ